MSPDEMLRSGIKKRLDSQKRAAKFPSMNCPELRGKGLRFLTKDDDKIQFDGNLVEYKLTHKQAAWGCLIGHPYCK
ncbi:uncharacterized protein TrAtP1_007890 [Trichoderma atroviride]|uniref:uncharacterized protein n=1 Tax=Hypocrea atroviridis TaxID=63577 RepID=UPI003320811B|nr:hypothetical protein TrAtP1_007890 [Trichoderma atroviride]